MADKADINRRVAESLRQRPRRAAAPAPTLDERVAEVLGMDPGARRLAMLPYPKGALVGQQGPVDWTDWTAPAWVHDMAKALVLPGHAAQGGQWTPDDVTDMAVEVGMLGGVAAPAPTGALGMFAGRRAKTADKEALNGETEARNVQTRMDMTPEQRRAAPPWETLDVPEDELIVRRPQRDIRRRVTDPLVSALEAMQDQQGGAPHPALGRALSGASTAASLPMDEASRMARALEMGFSDEAFYRGTAQKPTEGGIVYYSRDPEVARGHAGNDGHLDEYRLRTKKTLVFADDVSLRDYVDMVDAIEATAGPDAAGRLAAGAPIEGDWTPDKLRAAVPRHGDVPVMTGAALHQAVETIAGDAVAPLRAAGWDAIDTGRDVRTLTRRGQRSKGAAFDPGRLDKTDLLATNASPLMAALSAHLRERERRGGKEGRPAPAP